MLILLVEHALEHWPPGKWRQIWGFPLTHIIAARKLEKDKRAVDDVWSSFAGYGLEEKRAFILNLESHLKRMKELTEGEGLGRKVENSSSESERSGEANGPCLPHDSEAEKADEKQREWEKVLEYERIRQLAH